MPMASQTGTRNRMGASWFAAARASRPVPESGRRSPIQFSMAGLSGRAANRTATAKTSRPVSCESIPQVNRCSVDQDAAASDQPSKMEGQLLMPALHWRSFPNQVCSVCTHCLQNSPNCSTLTTRKGRDAHALDTKKSPTEGSGQGRNPDRRTGQFTCSRTGHIHLFTTRPRFPLEDRCATRIMMLDVQKTRDEKRNQSARRDHLAGFRASGRGEQRCLGRLLVHVVSRQGRQRGRLSP